MIIGAGLGGLAAAIRLQAAGYAVTVVEQRERPGGRAYQIKDAGFLFDTGPSLITMPWLLEELFAIAGRRLDQEVELVRLEPFYRIHWDGDERWLDFSGERDRMVAEIGKFSSSDADAYDGFMAASRPIYERGILDAGRRPFTRVRELAAFLPSMLRLRAAGRLDRFVARHFSDEHIRQAFSFHSLYIGGDPYRVPAIYAALAYLQVADGVWYAKGGVYALVEAMARAIEGRGGKIACGDGVERVLVRGGRAVGVRTAGGVEHPAEVVVSNADVLTRSQLVPDSPEPRPWRWQRLVPTMSCFLLYLGTDRVYEKLRHHTLIVGEGYRDFIADVTQRGRLGRSLSLYVHAPARTEAAMAPPGADSLAILLPVPNLRSGTDWSAEGDELRDRVVRHLEHDFGLEGLEASIRTEHRMTPADFAAQLGAVEGNAFAVEPTLRQSASFRPPNRDRAVRGLYHVGAGTHPGAGVPGVLLGAEVTAGLVLDDAAPKR